MTTLLIILAAWCLASVLFAVAWSRFHRRDVPLAKNHDLDIMLRRQALKQSHNYQRGH